jgi:rod shape-determining protein MreC
MKIAELESSIDYIKGIDQIMEFRKRYNIDGINCFVIFKNLDNKHHFFIIDKGDQDGVKENMIVLYKNNIIGKVANVYKYCSKINLITDKRIKIAAYCLNSKIDCLYEGINNPFYGYLSFVNSLDKIKESDIVISSGKGSLYPRGFIIGQIRSIKNRFSDSLIKIEPLIDLKSIDYCLLVFNKFDTVDLIDLELLN